MHDGASSPIDPAARAAIVTGATGLVGHFLLPRLAAAGWDVNAVSRRAAPPRSPDRVRWHQHDVAGGIARLGTEGATVVFHAAPLWLLPSLVPALSARGITRVVAFGSTSRFTKQHSADASSRAVADTLAHAEDDLARACGAHGIRWTIFRPTLIYGAGRDRNVSAIARVARRLRVVPIAGDGRGLQAARAR